MSIKEEDVGTLTRLGLTERQSKVYLALLRLGPSKAEAISKATLVHRQEIYRVALNLQDIGLVERKITTPVMFSAVPIDTAIKLLFNSKLQEFNLTRERARKLAKEIHRTDPPVDIHRDNEYFCIISGGDHNGKFKRATETAHIHIDLVTTWKRFRLGFSLLERSIKAALKRGVAINVLTEKPENDAFPKWVLDALEKQSSRLTIRTMANPAPTLVTIYDAAEVALCINPTFDFRGAHLWSNCVSMITVNQAYFNCMWSKFDLHRYPWYRNSDTVV